MILIIDDDGKPPIVLLDRQIQRVVHLVLANHANFITAISVPSGPAANALTDPADLADVMIRQLWRFGYAAAPTPIAEEPENLAQTAFRCILCDAVLELRLTHQVTSIHQHNGEAYTTIPNECVVDGRDDAVYSCPDCGLFWPAEWQGTTLVPDNPYQPYRRTAVEDGIFHTSQFDYRPSPDEEWEDHHIGCPMCPAWPVKWDCPCCHGQRMISIKRYREYWQEVRRAKTAAP